MSPVPGRFPGPAFLVLSLVASLAIALPLAPQAAAAKMPGARMQCTIKGTKKADELTGTAGKDVICGKGGDDRVSALGGDDYVFAGRGNDRASGDGGADHLLGDLGNDDLSGDAGGDFLYGERGNDELAGGPGRDALFGDLGNDRHRGGPGEDHISGGPGSDAGDPGDRDSYRDCPTSERICQFNMHLDITGYCPSFSVSGAGCVGKTAYANPGWAVYIMDLPASYGGFAWFPRFYGSYVNYSAVSVIPQAWLMGWVPSPQAAAYPIEDAWHVAYSRHWYTPLGPGLPGQVSGPLYINFVNGFIGADIYLDGYLVQQER